MNFEKIYDNHKIKKDFPEFKLQWDYDYVDGVYSVLLSSKDYYVVLKIEGSPEEDVDKAFEFGLGRAYLKLKEIS